MRPRSAVAKSTIVGLVSAVLAITLVTILLIGALAAQTLAVGTTLPGGGDPATFFLGGAWIDLAVVILVAFASGFLLTFRRLHPPHRSTRVTL